MNFSAYPGEKLTHRIDGTPATKKEGSSDSDLAEHAKSLKAANRIEATPQLIRRKQSPAEEPVATPIRRRVVPHWESVLSFFAGFGLCIESRLEAHRQVRCRTLPPKVHEVEGRLLTDHVVVQGDDVQVRLS